jgi:hypothetical protein
MSFSLLSLGERRAGEVRGLDGADLGPFQENPGIGVDPV